MTQPCSLKEKLVMASTSKFEAEFENTIETFGKMMIGCKKYRIEKKPNSEQKVDTEQPSCSKEAPKEQEKRRSSWSFRSSRYTPYLLPIKKIKARSKSVSEIDFEALKTIRLKGNLDMDYLKLEILGEKKNIPCGCSVEAQRRPPTPDLEVEELSAYFSHFVQVELKISAMAESMYC